MKKTLLIAAAALAAGMLSVQAQSNVYSQNIVGYYNVTIPAFGYSPVGNQLLTGTDANKTNNNVNAIFNGTGLVSDSNGGNNSVLYYWTGTTFSQFQYFTDADANAWFGVSAGNGFYDAGGTLQNLELKQGGGSFIYNPTASPLTNTFSGSVFQGTNSVTIANGYNMLSFVVPVSADLVSTNSYANYPGTSDSNGANNDVLYKWNGTTYAQFQYFTDADANAWFGVSAGNGFYDAGGTLQNSTIPVGQAFFILHNGPTVVWTPSVKIN